MTVPTTAQKRALAQAIADTIVAEGTGWPLAAALDALMSAYVCHFVAAGYDEDTFDRLVAPTMRGAIVEQRAERRMPVAGHC